MSSVWVDSLTPRLILAEKVAKRAIIATAERYAGIAESEAKANAPWTDRTGNARNGIGSAVYEEGDQIVLALYHQVPYGIYLEVKSSGKYAVIMPTINDIGPRLMKTLNQIMGAL